MKTIYVHTNPLNAAKVAAFVDAAIEADGDKIEPSGADAAVLLKKDKDGAVVGEVVAVVSAGLPKVHEIIDGYRKQGVMPFVVGAVAAEAPADAKKPAKAENE